MTSEGPAHDMRPRSATPVQKEAEVLPSPLGWYLFVSSDYDLLLRHHASACTLAIPWFPRWRPYCHIVICAIALGGGGIRRRQWKASVIRGLSGRRWQ